jgi:outer membrane protein, heavy metal efflux system
VPLFQASIVSGAVVLTLAAAPAFAEPPALTLDQYVETVVRHHPAGREAEALIRSAAAEKKASQVLPDPTFEVSRDRARDSRGARATESGLALTQTIPWPGTFLAGVRAGNRAADVFRASAEAARWELIATASRAFWGLVAARARLDIARRTEEDARSLRDLVQRRAELGATRESDRIKAEVEWLRQEQALRAVAQENRTAESVLRALAGADLPQPLALDGELPAESPAIDRADVEALLGRNPRMRAARAEAQRQEALAAVARRGRVPDLEVKVFRDREIDKQVTGASMGIRLPLWNANRGEIARAEAAAAVAKNAAERTALEIGVELAERLRDLEMASGQAALLMTEVLPKSGEGLRLARLTYEEGETSLLDLLDAQRTWREAQREAVDARVALAAAVTELQQLVGPELNPWR